MLPLSMMVKLSTCSDNAYDKMAGPLMFATQIAVSTYLDFKSGMVTKCNPNALPNAFIACSFAL